MASLQEGMLIISHSTNTYSTVGRVGTVNDYPCRACVVFPKHIIKEMGVLSPCMLLNRHDLKCILINSDTRSDLFPIVVFSKLNFSMEYLCKDSLSKYQSHKTNTRKKIENVITLRLYVCIIHSFTNSILLFFVVYEVIPALFTRHVQLASMLVSKCSVLKQNLSINKIDSKTAILETGSVV